MPVSRTEEVHAELQAWLCAHIAHELGLPDGSLDPAEPMSAYGLDSVRAVTILAEVEEHVGLEIDPNALWEYPSPASFTGLLVELLEHAGRSPAGEAAS